MLTYHQAETVMRKATSLEPTNSHVSTISHQVVAAQKAEKEGKSSLTKGDDEAAWDQYKVGTTFFMRPELTRRHWSSSAHVVNLT